MRLRRYIQSIVFLLSIAILWIPSYAQALVVPGDPIAWWEFNDTSDSAPGGSRTLNLIGGASISSGALSLSPSSTDPNPRAVTSAFNPTDSFSVIIDFQFSGTPSGGSDPQFIPFSNIGDDDASSSNFDTSAGYQLFFKGSTENLHAWQKSTSGFTQTSNALVSLSSPLVRHTVVVNWENTTGNSFQPTIFLDGSSTTATDSPNPMDFTSSTNDFILGTNVDYKKGLTRTMDGSIFEAAIFSGNLSDAQVDLVASDGISALAAPIPEPATLLLLGTGLAGLGFVRRKRKI